jgi:hypothetical protein
VRLKNAVEQHPLDAGTFVEALQVPQTRDVR